MNSGPSLIRRTVWSSVALLLVLPWSLWAAAHGLAGMTNHPLQWISNGSHSGADFAWFTETFEHYDPIAIGWAGSTPDDPRIERVVRGLEGFTTGTERLFVGVASGQQAFDELTRGPLELSPAEAFDRLYPAMMGPEGETLVVALLAPEAALRTKEALATIYHVAEQAGLLRDEVHLGGPSVESVAIDAASMQSLYQNVAPSAIAVMLVAWPCLRSLWLTAVVGALAGTCEAIALSFVYYAGSPFTGLLVVMPALIFVVFISGAVHFCNYYFDAVKIAQVKHLDPDWAAVTALRVGWFPCALASGTTAVGIFSLSTSRIEPVQVFAFFAGSGVLLSLAVLLLVLPGITALHARWRMRADGSAGSAASFSAMQDASANGAPWLVAKSIGSPWPVTLGFCVLTVVSAAGIRGLKPTMDQADFFPSDSKTILDTRWLEQHIGPLLPLEIAVAIDKQCPMEFGERIQWVRETGLRLAGLQSVGGCVSVATFAPELDSGESGLGIGDIVRRRTVFRELQNRREEFLNTPFLAEQDDDEIWRLSLRVVAGKEHERVAAEVRDALEKSTRQLPPGALSRPPIVTGLYMLIADSRQQLLVDLTTSFSLALIVIAIVLATTFRSVVLGAASIIPNIFPSVVVFGCMGWSQADIDVGAMITASVGMGIAVDDTVHYLTWYTESRARGCSAKAAAVEAHRRCAPAMLRTTLICGAGLAVFLFSPLVLAARFAGMICVLLAAALVGDLLFLPAILCGPLWWYRPRADQAQTRGLPDASVAE